MSGTMNADRKTVLFTLALFAAATIAAAAPYSSRAQSDASDELVLVAGATGRTGREVVSELLANGYEVRAFVRNIDKARSVLPTNIDFAVGDIRQRNTVTAALDGVTMIISSIGASFNDPDNSPEFVDYGGVATLAEEAANANLKQFVLMSSGGVTHEDHILNQRFKNVLIWKFKGEAAVRNSGVPYTIVRPGGLTDEPGNNTELLFMQGDGHEGKISRIDVARVLVASLGNPDALSKTFEVFGTDEDPASDLESQFRGLVSD